MLCRSYSLRSRLIQSKAEQTSRNDAEPLSAALSPHIETGFQLAAAHGPLCAEPMEGLAFFLESLEIDAEGLQKEMCMLWLDCPP
jgi:ribosome assembly protein 1